jgi:O-antigen ligase
MKTLVLDNIKNFFKPSLVVIYLYILFSFIAKPPILPEYFTTYSIYLVIVSAIWVTMLHKTIYWNKYLTWGFSIFALCFISVLYAHNSNQVLKGLYVLFIPLALAFSFTQLITEKRDIKNILIVLAVSSGVLYFFMMRHGLFVITSGERLGNEAFGNANGFASMVFISVLAAISSIYLSRNRLLWVCMAVVIILDFHMLFLSEGRKYILLPILFAFLLFLKETGFKFNKLFLFVALIIIALPIVYTTFSNTDFMSDTLISRFEMTAAMLQGDEINMGDGDVERRLMIDKGFEYFLNSPIWGNGHKNFGYLFAIETNSTDYGHFSHNNYVELLCNLGLIAFCIYYLFYYKLLKLSLKNNSKESSLIFAFIITLMVAELGIISYYGNLFINILIFFASLLTFNKQNII